MSKLKAIDERIKELESENDELLEAWSNQAETICEQIKRIAELESLVRDMWEFGESSNYPYTPLESVRWAQMRKELGERFETLGLDVDA